ncbi:MAG: alpha/beta fold hydrolase [Haloarculaceae archaeon]
MEIVTHQGRVTAYRFVGSGGARAPEEGETGGAGVDRGICYVHGSGGSHRLWARQFGPDAPARPAVALDLSGHGESDDVDTVAGPATLEAYADDLVAVAEATGTRVLVGNSLGGAVVQHVLLERALPVDGAVLLGSGAKLAVLEELRAWLAADFETAVEFLHGPDRLFHDPDPKLLERSKAEMRATGRAVTERDFLTAHAFDGRDRLGEISVPVLAVVGEHDQLTPPRYHEYLATEIPDGRLETVADAAHLAMLERPGAVNEAIGGYVASIASD